MKRPDKRILGLFLLTVGLLAILVPSGLVYAQQGKVDLTLFLLPGNYPDNVTPGEDNLVYMEVRNSGSSDITDIQFLSDAPPGWKVIFTPGSLDSLSPGSSNTISVNVIPVQDARNGNYTVTLVAQANETRAVTSDYLRVRGGTSFWLWVGAGIAALVIIGFVVVFLRFGRQ